VRVCGMGVGLWRPRLRGRRRRMWICLGTMSLLRLRGRVRRSRQCRGRRHRRRLLLHRSKRDRGRVCWDWTFLVDRSQLLRQGHRVLGLQHLEFQVEQISSRRFYHSTHPSQLQRRNLNLSSNLNQTWVHSPECNHRLSPRQLSLSPTHNPSEV
jgi:hypothetical protein